jgi:hypothetical protein
MKSRLSIDDYGAVLSPAAAPFLEDMARKAVMETRKHFGNSVSLFTPLYIANYCENHVFTVALTVIIKFAEESLIIRSWRKN